MDQARIVMDTLPELPDGPPNFTEINFEMGIVEAYLDKGVELAKT